MPQHIIYLPIAERQLGSNQISIYDQHGQPIDFRSVEISCCILIKKKYLTKTFAKKIGYSSEKTFRKWLEVAFSILTRIVSDDSIMRKEIYPYSPYTTTYRKLNEIRIAIQSQDSYLLPCESFLYMQNSYIYIFVIKKKTMLFTIAC